MHACIILKMAFVGEENIIFHCLWSQCSRTVLNHIIGSVVDHANRLGLCVCVYPWVLGVLRLISVLGYWDLLLSFTTHTSLPHTPLEVPANHYPSSFLLLLPASVCTCCHGDHCCSPHTLSHYLFQCEDEAVFLLVMQAGCRRHQFPWEEGLFLPLTTK